MDAKNRVCDFQDEMRGYADFSVAMEVQNAIQSAINEKLIEEKDILSQRALGEIRGKIYQNAKENSDPLASLFAALISKNANPTEAALQLIEKRMRLMSHM